MSKENFTKFMSEYLPKDVDTQQRLDQHKQDTDNFVNTLVDVGNKNGYEFTREEALDVLPTADENLKALQQQADGELSDADLAAVAGGASFGSFSNTTMTKSLKSFKGFELPGGGVGMTTMCCW